MKKYSKIYEYKKYKFNISVELNTKVERGLNGKKYHTVILNDMGATNFYIKELVLDETLLSYIDVCIAKAKLFVDERSEVISKTEQNLLSDGFILN